MLSPEKKLHVLIPSKVAPEVLSVLQEYEGLEVEAPGDLDASQLAAALPRADAVIIRSNVEMTRACIDAAPRLRVIGRAGTGLDNVDVEAATRRGIVVMNTPGANANSTAEHALAMLLALARHIPAADRAVKAGRWERGRFQGIEVLGKTLGIVGLGRIGTLLARRALALGMQVVAHDPFVAAETLRDHSIDLMPLDDLLRTADFISVHTPLGPKTEHLIGSRELALVRRGVRLVNCARGGILDEEALCDAIDAGTVAGAALDVFETEPPAGSRVLGYEQILTTPHLGGSSEEAERNVGLAIARQVADYLTKGIIVHAVNAYPVTGETRAQLGPFLDLAERLGSLAAQLLTGAPVSFGLTLHGERFGGDVEVLVASALKGVLSVALEGDSVNLVNARALARERGLEVEVARGEERDDFSNLIRVRIASDSDAHEIAGTQLGKRTLHVVGIDGFGLEMVPRGWMLVSLSENRPGMIGRMGTIVGKHGGNINKMNNGCDDEGRWALSTMSLDAEPVAGMLKDLGREPAFRWIRLVHL